MEEHAEAAGKAQEGAAHEEHVDTMLGIVFPYINFAIFLAAAIFFFRKPAKAAAAKKRDAYEKLLAESKAAYEEAAAKLAEMKARQAGLDKEIQDLKNTAKAAADIEAAKIVGDAERLADHLRQEARRIAQAEVDKARAALRQEIVDAVKEGVTQKLKTELTNDAQLSLVKNRIGDLNSLRAGG